MPILLSPDAVAELLGLERDTVLAMSRRGELPEPIRINARTLRFRGEDIADRLGLDPAKISRQVSGGPTS